MRRGQRFLLGVGGSTDFLLIAFLRLVHHHAAGVAGCDDVADMRYVGEVFGGAVELGASEVAGGIRPRRVRTLAGESGRLEAVRDFRDAGPCAADVRLLRTLPCESGRLTARYLGDTSQSRLLERSGGTGAGEVLLDLSLKKTRGTAGRGAALFQRRIALGPDDHASRGLYIFERLGVENGIVRNVDIAAQLRVRVKAAMPLFPGLAKPAGKHPRFLRVFGVTDDVSDEVSVLVFFVSHVGLLWFSSGYRWRWGSFRCAACRAARGCRSFLHGELPPGAALPGLKSARSR
jgi:hypothetical protein